MTRSIDEARASFLDDRGIEADRKLVVDPLDPTVDAPDRPVPLAELAENVTSAANELSAAYTDHANAVVAYTEACAGLTASEKRVEKARAALRHYSDRLNAAAATEVEVAGRSR